ncbi:hypothetical protein NE237_009191 [Protea cynaroides]|uniref:Uncharacterized protein n=1 Tax=Protea cynaroides TaxID=273540 RepID=A0A9Q0KY50_9MAGN|nr:hypothetical protein NE237_009191 [Protea cynaroides]
MDGFFVPLCNVQLMKSPLFLQGKVKQAIPSSWDPSALARVWTQVYSTAKGYTLNPLVLLTLLEKKYGTIYTFFKKYTSHNVLQFTSLEYIGPYIRSQWFFH